jgi:hypothetical protein
MAERDIDLELVVAVVIGSSGKLNIPKEGRPRDKFTSIRGGFEALLAFVRQFGPGHKASSIPSDKLTSISGDRETGPRLVVTTIWDGVVRVTITGGEVVLGRHVGHSPPRMSREMSKSMRGGRELGPRLVLAVFDSAETVVVDVTRWDELLGLHVGQRPPSMSKERLMSIRGGLETTPLLVDE